MNREVVGGGFALTRVYKVDLLSGAQQTLKLSGVRSLKPQIFTAVAAKTTGLLEFDTVYSGTCERNFRIIMEPVCSARSNQHSPYTVYSQQEVKQSRYRPGVSPMVLGS